MSSATILNYDGDFMALVRGKKIEVRVANIS